MPAELAGSLLIRELGDSLPSYTFIDFCAGGGGPTPSIGQVVNEHLRAHRRSPVNFVLTDLHPNINAWEAIARKNPDITYWTDSVDASCAPESLLARHRGDRGMTMRLFNLSFHHFDDHMARSVLKDTVKTSNGFAIFELQERSFASVLTMLFGVVLVILAAPFYAWKWRSPVTFVFSWVIPILPLTFMWDSCVSALRTREPEEIEALLRTCGADTRAWEMRSGSDRYLWPHGSLNWVICKPVERKY